MLKSSEYFSFKCNWRCDHDLATIVDSVQYQKLGDWSGEQGEGEPQCLEFVTFTRTADTPDHLEVKCCCSPHLNVSIFGLELVSEIRTLELYSNCDGYLKSCKGRQLQKCDADCEETEENFYHCCVKLDDAVNDLVIKFITPVDRTDIHIKTLQFKLLQGDPNINPLGAAPNMIDMGKVRGYLHSMGDNLPAQALEMMESVEQFQQSQMSSLSQLTSGSALSNLLSMVNPKTLQGTRSSERQDKSQDFETNPSLSETVETTPSPLQAMLRQMTGGNSSLDGDTGSKEEDGMFQMLQNICGRVSQLRVKDNQAQKNIGDAKLPADQTSEHTSAEDLVPDKEQSLGTSLAQLQTVLEQTVSQMVQSSEQRLKEYIDTSLKAMEDRLCAKMDAIVKLLEKNGHSQN